MIFDWDDLHEGNDRLDLLERLKEANQAFRCTAFAIPSLCPDDYLDSLPDWIEVVPHGWEHGDPSSDGGECREWSRAAMDVLIRRITTGHPRWARGFKAPGWQISDGCYEGLEDAGWWVADQPYNNGRRPTGLRTHLVGGPEHWHGHIQNVCGNGLEETFDTVLQLVRDADSFELVSEVAK